MLIETVLIETVSTIGLVPAQNPEPPQGQLPEWGSAAPVGLALVLVLMLATAFLIHNMSKRIKRLPQSFDDRPVDDDPAVDGPEDGAKKADSGSRDT
ncbi:hypothetical protein WIS52_14225 [Pseudonocardia nematodicida]|uniref:Secreted protein n=1 Tax=Pseudonocardia nematodicida TaxID=1206997 RepID=A0ABV1KE56_9PSEU